MKQFISLCLISVLLLAGCATSYQESGLTGGFEETQLAPDVVRVTFNGNGYTGKQRTQDFALLRAAELSLMAGYPFFVLLSESTETKAYNYTSPGTSYSTGYVNSSGYYSGSTTHYPGANMKFYKPETGILVKFLKEKPANVMAYDAEFLTKSIKQKYKL